MKEWKKGWVILYLKKGQVVEPSRLKKGVKEAGFTPTWIEITAVGQLISQDKESAFKVSETEQLFRLQENEPLRKLRESGGSGEREITLVGKIQEEGGLPLSLSIKSFQIR